MLRAEARRAVILCFSRCGRAAGRAGSSLTPGEKKRIVNRIYLSREGRCSARPLQDTEEEDGNMVAQLEPVVDSMEQGESTIDRARAGDRTAYGELVQRFRPAIYSVLLAWLRDPAEADDVAQEVFLHSMRKISQLRDSRCFTSWLRQIAVRLALNRVNRRRPVSSLNHARQALLPGNGDSPLDEILRAEEQDKVHEGLSHLKPLDRAMLEAFYLRSRSLREMSEEFEAPLGTIKRRLHTARQRLKQFLEMETGKE
jgi:RNA polymerase sigma-70 factor (ECF subfamily)